VRKQIGEQVSRGQVTARITYEKDEAFSPASVKALSDAKKQWEKIATKLGYEAKKAIDLSFLLSKMPREGGADLIDFDKAQKALKDAVGAALRELVAMKVREGENLVKDLLLRLKGIEQHVKKVEKLSPQMKETLAKKMRENVQGLFPLSKESEERFFRELAFFAEKCDVTEELTRLHSHIDQFRSILSSKEISVGRTLDFLAQEMHREMNTIASKAADDEIAKISIAMRGECEKIREQVQNIE